jgi:hypothetical protein
MIDDYDDDDNNGGGAGGAVSGWRPKQSNPPPLKTIVKEKETWCGARSAEEHKRSCFFLFCFVGVNTATCKGRETR